MSTTDDTTQRPDRHGGPIDPHSPFRLQDIVDGELNDPMYHKFEYEGFHIGPMGGGKYRVQLDGHVGIVETIDPDDYDRVDELVADLNRLVTLRHEYGYQDDLEGLVEWAGHIMTSDEEQADAQPDRYVFIPSDRPDPDEFREPFDAP